MNLRRVAPLFAAIACALPAGATHPVLTGEIAAHVSNQNVSPAVAVHPLDDSFVAAYKLGAEVFIDRWNGTAWMRITSFTAANAGLDVLGDDLSIAIDPNGNLHAALNGYVGGLVPSAFRDVVYGFFDATLSMWSFEMAARYSDSNGHINPDNPQVAWNANLSMPELLWTVSNASNSVSPTPSHTLNHAIRSGPSTWSVQTIQMVDGPGSLLNNATFTIAPGGVAHAAFFLRDPQLSMNPSLMYGNNSTANFVFAPIVTGGVTSLPGKANAIALGPTGNVHIAYCDYLNDALHHITNQSGSFVDELVDGVANTDRGRRCVIDVNENNDVLIAYQNHTNGKLKTALRRNGEPWHLQPIGGDNVQNARFIGAAINILGEYMVVHDAKVAENDKHVLHAFLGPCAPPSIPGNVSATDGSIPAFVRITWNTAPVAAEYQVFRNTATDPNTAQLIGTTTQTSFDDITANPPSFASAGTAGFTGNTPQFSSTPYLMVTVALLLILIVPFLTKHRPRGQQIVSANPTTKRAPARAFLRGAFAAFVLVALIQIPTGCKPPRPNYEIYHYWVKALNACGEASDFSDSDSGYRGTAK